MSRHANAQRFGEAGVPGSWYRPAYPTTIEEAEARLPQFRQRAAWLAERFPTVTTIGIAGAGFGITAYYLAVNHGKDPWCCDIGWAATIGAGVLKQYSTRIAAHDVTTSAGAEGFRRMGNKGRSLYPLVFTEDLLPCANDEAEARLMLTNLRVVASQLVHLVTPSDGAGTVTTSDMLWRTAAEWRSIVGPDEVIVLPSLVEVP